MICVSVSNIHARVFNVYDHGEVIMEQECGI